MKMKISPPAGGKIELEHEVLKIEKREKPVYFKYSPASAPSIRFRCSLCGKIQVGNDWVDPDKSDLEEINKKFGGITVAYTVCPVCQKMLPSTGSKITS